MAANSDFKLIKKKELDKDTTLKISKNIMSGRIFVEFICSSPRLTLQRNFQDTMAGKLESEEFAKSIKSTDQLREHFGLKKKD